MASERSFSFEEKQLFDTLFNTHNFEKLKEIEKNPGKFWHERQERLGRTTMSHEDFCAIYTEKAKNSLQKRIAQTQHEPTYHPVDNKHLWAIRTPPKELWFHPDINVISATLESYLEKDDPLFQDMQLQLYSLACDYMSTPTDSGLFGIKTEDRVRTMIKVFIPRLRPLSSQTLQNKKRWLTTTNGKCAIFDKLVMLGQDRYLCTTPEDYDQWAYFSTRFDQFRGSFDASHYKNLQAQSQERVTTELERIGISGQKYFQLCYSPENLITNNLVELCRQTLGCFCNFHEEPFDTKAWCPNDRQSLLFPTATDLLDEGLLEIVPYLAQIPPDYDWKTKPLPFVRLSQEKVHRTLLDWRDQYCSAGKGFLL